MNLNTSYRQRPKRHYTHKEIPQCRLHNTIYDIPDSPDSGHRHLPAINGHSLTLYTHYSRIGSPPHFNCSIQHRNVAKATKETCCWPTTHNIFASDIAGPSGACSCCIHPRRNSIHHQAQLYHITRIAGKAKRITAQFMAQASTCTVWEPLALQTTQGVAVIIYEDRRLTSVSRSTSAFRRYKLLSEFHHHW